MIRLREKLKYMLFGGLLAFAGFMFGSMNSETTAQSGSETIDKLTVRELNVTEAMILRDDTGRPAVIISSNEKGGSVIAYSKSKIGAAHLSAIEDSGALTVTGIGKAGVIIATSSASRLSFRV